MKRRWIDLGSYYQGLIVVGTAYVLIFGWMIIAGHGVPYVMDNNETFSVWWHSYNLFHFDFWKSFGLTDEAFSFDPDAHPVVHPHQGNWPRIFGFLIFVLGARTVEAQTIVTVFTVGVFGIFCAYRFLSKIVNPEFSTIFCLFLISDYVLYAQWHIGTYRVWHIVFFYSTLICVSNLTSKKVTKWIIVTISNYTFLYYYELVFATYVSAAAAFYTMYLYWRRPTVLAKAVAAQLLGTSIGLGILIFQLVQFYGLDGLKSDFYFTFLARNHFASLQQTLSEMHSFYEGQDIAFWYNINDNTLYLHLSEFIRSFFSYDFQTHTPVLSALAIVLALPGLFICYRGGKGKHAKPKSPMFSVLPGLALCSSFAIFLLAVWSPFMIAATTPSDGWLEGRHYLLAVLGALILAAGSRWLAGTDLLTAQNSQWAGVMSSAVMIGAAACFIRYHSLLYGRNTFGTASPLLWQELGTFNYSAFAFQLAITAAAVLAAAAMISSGLRAWTDLRGGRAYLVCCVLGYAVAYILSAGYIYSGYLDRSAPFTVFITNAVLAIAGYVLFRGVRDGVATIRDQGGSIRRVVATALPGCLLVTILTSWAWQQLAYIRMLPPNFIEFMSKLSQPPYRGATFTVGAYAAPTADYTRNWAYLSDGWDYWARRQAVTADQGSVVPSLARESYRELPYLWMADRRVNTSYLTPEYYLCFYNPTLVQLAESLRLARGDSLVHSCGSLTHLVEGYGDEEERALTPKLVDYDREGIGQRGWQAWAIVKLDWDLPPFLRPVGPTSGQRPVEIQAASVDDHYRIDYRYLFAQGDGAKEQGSRVELVKVGTTAGCGDPHLPLTVLAEGKPTEDDRFFDLPGNFLGKVAVRVTPRTATKAGRAFYSEVLSFARTESPLVCLARWTLPGEPTSQQLQAQGYLIEGNPIDFRALADGSRVYLREGWSEAEIPGKWAVDQKSTLIFKLQGGGSAAHSLRFAAKVLPFLAPGRPREVVTMQANGRKVANWTFSQAGWTTIDAVIPADLLAEQPKLELTFISDDGVTPQSLGISSDTRRLKLLFENLVISADASIP